MTPEEPGQTHFTFGLSWGVAYVWRDATWYDGQILHMSFATAFYGML